MNALNRLKEALDGLLGLPPHIAGTHLEAVDQLLSRKATLELIDDVLADEATLKVIADRSYTHTLGFRKITLLEPVIDLPGGGKGSYQVRLHIWQPDSKITVPLVESKHEHSFDFISRVLLGEMENQCYTMHALTAAEEALLTRLTERIEQLDAGQRQFANSAVEALEALRMARLGSRQAELEGLTVDRAGLEALLGLAADELDMMVALQGRFQYDAVASKFGGNYVHSMTGSVSLRPAAVLRLAEGDLYHHASQYIHRLYMKAQKANATLIVTTPLEYGALGASFQHPTWFSGEHVGYERRMYTAKELAGVLRKFRQELAALPDSSENRLLDVSKEAAKTVS